jgi:hypothetical protein
MMMTYTLDNRADAPDLVGIGDNWKPTADERAEFMRLLKAISGQKPDDQLICICRRLARRENLAQELYTRTATSLLNRFEKNGKPVRANMYLTPEHRLRSFVSYVRQRAEWEWATTTKEMYKDQPDHDAEITAANTWKVDPELQANILAEEIEAAYPSAYTFEGRSWLQQMPNAERKFLRAVLTDDAYDDDAPAHVRKSVTEALSRTVKILKDLNNEQLSWEAQNRQRAEESKARSKAWGIGRKIYKVTRGVPDTTGNRFHISWNGENAVPPSPTFRKSTTPAEYRTSLTKDAVKKRQLTAAERDIRGAYNADNSARVAAWTTITKERRPVESVHDEASGKLPTMEQAENRPIHGTKAGAEWSALDKLNVDEKWKPAPVIEDTPQHDKPVDLLWQRRTWGKITYVRPEPHAPIVRLEMPWITLSQRHPVYDKAGNLKWIKRRFFYRHSRGEYWATNSNSFLTGAPIKNWDSDGEYQSTGRQDFPSHFSGIVRLHKADPPLGQGLAHNGPLKMRPEHTALPFIDRVWAPAYVTTRANGWRTKRPIDPTLPRTYRIIPDWLRAYLEPA